MAIGAVETFTPDRWHRQLFMESLKAYDPWAKWFAVSVLPTEESIRNDVGKLRSVSPAAQEWIVDQRVRRASVGPHRGTFVIPHKDTGYPTII